MLRGLYKTDVCTITADRTLKDVAKLMRDRNIGDIVVVESRDQQRQHGGKGREPYGGLVPIGMITDRDIVVTCVAEGEKNFESIKVGDVMSKSVVFVKEDTGLFDTIRKMRENGVSRILVVDDNKTLMGILTSQRIFDLLNEELQELGQIAKHQRTMTASQGADMKLPPNLTSDQAQGLRH